MNIPKFIKENDITFKSCINATVNIYDIKKSKFTFPDIFIYESPNSKIIDTALSLIPLTNIDRMSTSIIIPSFLLDNSIHKYYDVNADEMFIFDINSEEIKTVPLLDKIRECKNCSVAKLNFDLFDKFPISEIKSKIKKIWIKYSKMDQKKKISSLIQNFLLGCVINVIENKQKIDYYSNITIDLLKEFDIIKNDPRYIHPDMSDEKIVSNVIQIKNDKKDLIL